MVFLISCGNYTLVCRNSSLADITSDFNMLKVNVKPTEISNFRLLFIIITFIFKTSGLDGPVVMQHGHRAIDPSLKLG